MALIEQQLYELLRDDAAISAVVSTRIFPVTIPEQTIYPAISYQTISNRDITTLNYDNPDLNFKRIQINIWSDKYPDVKNLETLIKTAIYTGTFSGRVESIRDINDKELKIFGASIDIIASNK